MNEQLYTGKIDEFVDWVSGENVFTGQQKTDGQKVSGGSIRELLQEKLRNPIHVEEDPINNLYRIFSSKTSHDLWAENPSDNADLQLFTIPRPSDYVLDFTLDNYVDRYIKVGDDTSPLSKVHFTWKIKNEETTSVEGINITYNISNADGTQHTFIRRKDNGQAEDLNIYKYLKPGENSVSFEAKGNATGAHNSASFTITLLDLKVSCGFNFAGKHTKNESLRVPYSFYRNNVNGSAKIYFIVDDGAGNKTSTVDIFEGGQLTTEDSGKMMSPTLTEGQHTLQVYAEATYNAGSVTVYSNLLYFTFTVDTSEVGSTDKFINIATSFTNGTFPFSQLTLTTIQYYKTSLQWGYYTYAANTDTKLAITWKLLNGEDDQDPQILPQIEANTGYEASKLEYVPTIYTDNTQLYLAAYYNPTASTEQQLIRIPIYITRNEELNNIYETDNYELKMTAFGRTNTSNSRSVWKDVTDTITTQFVNIDWNPNSGWYENSFRTSGSNQYALINFDPFVKRYQSSNVNEQPFPFKYGKTIEIEFESEKVSDPSDVLITIGNPTGAHIEITPNTATLFDNGSNNVPNEVVHTNYKANERIKLAFIINKVEEDPEDKTADDGLAYIVNNGILERGAIANGRSFATSGKIKIGGSNSGVRVYSIRIYDKSISYNDAYNNFVYDSDDKVNIVQRNNILSQGQISFNQCVDKIDTIVITGNLTNILDQNSDKDDSETDVMIERICYYDSTKDFVIGDIIDDPDRPGKKKVVNGCQIRKHGQSTLNYPIASMKFWLNKSKSGDVPIFKKTNQANMLLNKNRYKMKDTSIPSNKFVLQANYADSSGVHNGGLLRLIQDSWYNARIQGVSDPYKLRTLPQLFTSIKSNEKQNYGLDHVWADYFPKNNFPYTIRTGPDSFPCAVFYEDLNGSGEKTFLGQYVFMEDKKSDYVYGERSIYKVATDPFCLTTTHKDDDIDANRIWDNGNVLRIEVLEINKSYSSYQTTDGFETFSGGRYGWESQFEMIYPDPDDIEKDDDKDGILKSNPQSKFCRKAKPFIDWYKWVVSTKDNQQKFQEEAADHLDLYKMAAYYIFVLRFALVDSLERNAQIKTYDGVHFHYEPWDMDIALGNKNDGGIAFNPPVDRNTKLNTQTYAISGRAANENGEVISSNWLWDALEAWPYWTNEIVPKVADALFNTGVLTYNNISEMFDENYANAWCEIMYNRSGHFKYVESAGGDLQRWLGWLQGARMSHRHWWLSTSMDYYDAKWFCGDYKSHRIYLAANISADPNKKFVITPNSSTYMTITINYMDENTNEETEEVDDTRAVSKNDPLMYYMTDGASTKAPMHVYGANFMEQIDMSDIAIGIDALDLTGTYSQVLGAPLKVLNIGTPIVGSDYSFTTTLSPSTCGVSPSQSGINAFENLETLNIRGHKHLGNVNQFSFGINQWIRDLNMTQLKNFYAMGSNLINFYSSNSGNNFQDIELPSSVSILNIKNSTWNNMTFWDTTEGQNDQATLTYHQTMVDGVGINVPPTVTEVHFLGSTGRTRESLIFVRNWIKSIVATYGESALSNYTLEMDDVFWSPDVIGNDEDLLTFDELRLISKMNGEEPEPGSNVTKTHPISGYVMLKYEGQGTELSAQQLTQIRNWFGDTVFTKGSAGLVVDYKHDYIQINIGGDVSLTWDEINQEYAISMYEGGSAILSATEFHLAEPDQQSISNYAWGLSEPGSAESTYQIGGVTLISADSTSDHNWYLFSSESQVGHDYDVEVKVTAGGQTYSSIIHIIAVKYPSSINIGMTRNGTIEPRTSGNVITLWQNGASCNIFVNTNDQAYTASVRQITYTVTANNNRQGIYSTKTGPGWEGSQFNIDDRVNIQECTQLLGLSDTPCIKVGCPNGVPANNDIFEYNITATVLYNSDREDTVTAKVLVMSDSTPIVSALQPFLYQPIATRWLAQTGETLAKPQLYRTDLLALTGTLTFVHNETASANSFVTAKGNDSLLKHIPNVEGMVIDNNADITSTHNSVVEDNHNQFIFSNMPNLKILSIQNCTGLSEPIDLTMCPNIEQVDASGTSINVLIPTNAAHLTKYELGTPTSITLDSPTILQPTGVDVDNYANIASLDIVDINGNKSFTMFDKITTTYIYGGNVIFNKTMSYGSNGYYIKDSQYNSKFVTSYIPVQGNTNISVQTGNNSCALYYYNQNKEYISMQSINEALTMSTGTGTSYYIVISNTAAGGGVYQDSTISVKDTDNDIILFEWRA